MKREIFSVAGGALLVLLVSSSAWSASPKAGSPQAVVSKALDAVNHGRIDEFVAAMDPDSLEELRAAVVGSLDEAVQKAGEARVLQSFPGVKTVKDLKALDGRRLFTGILRRQLSDPGTKAAVANTRIDVYGHISQGDDTAHVVYRSRMKLGETDIVRLNVSTLRKSGKTWKMVIPEEFAGPMKKGGSANLMLLNPAAKRIEPLGHVMAGKEAALIVYRLSVPSGDSTISKLAVMELMLATRRSSRCETIECRR